MPEHLRAEDIERFRRRAMTSRELSDSYEHLDTCEMCRQRVKQAVQPQRAFDSFLAGLKAELPEHLLYEQAAAYVDDEMDEVTREIAASHLQSCPPCAERVQQLQAFKAEGMGLAAIPPAPISAPTRWQGFVAFWRSPVHWIPLQVLATAAIVLLCVWVATLSLRTRAVELQAERDRLQQTNDALQKQSSAIAEMQARITELEQKNAGLQQDNKKVRASADELQAQLTKALQIQAQKPQNVPSQPLIALNDNGRRVGLNERGEITGLESLPPAYEQSVKKALTTAQLETPTDLAEFVGGSGSLVRGASEGVAFALVSPVGTAVQSDHPTFRWQKLDGASGYIVTIFDASFHRVANSELLAQAEWRMPTVLERGKTYSWQVTAIKGNEKINSPTTPAPEAKFKVLEAASFAALQSAQQTYPNSHLVLGVLYARAGLLDDAERELQALVQANPKSAIARNLRRRIKVLRQN